MTCSAPTAEGRIVAWLSPGDLLPDRPGRPAPWSWTDELVFAGSLLPFLLLYLGLIALAIAAVWMV
jgi:hypothetical protein